jgi:hypothetical protein
MDIGEDWEGEKEKGCEDEGDASHTLMTPCCGAEKPLLTWRTQLQRPVQAGAFFRKVRKETR